MQQIKIQTPAKINLTLEVLGKRPDGFHAIQSIMHTVGLFDYLTISVFDTDEVNNGILLSGTSNEIPYDEKNIVYKAAKLFFDELGIQNKSVKIFIEKNIPVAAGLAGGSTNASGTLFGLNEIFANPLSAKELHKIAASLGSDLNFCLDGGCALCTGRGEVIEQIPAVDFSVSLIKPKNLGISAKEAYQKFALLHDKSIPNNTLKLKELLLKNQFDGDLIYNSLEKAILPGYKVLRELKSKIPGSMMSGSGPTFFVLGREINGFDEEEFEIFNDLKSVNFGAKKV